MKEEQKKRRTTKKKQTGTKLVINDFSWKEARLTITLLVLTLLVVLVAIGLHRGKNNNEVVSNEKIIKQLNRYIPKDDLPDIKSYVLRDIDIKEARNVLDNFIKAKSAEQAKIWIRNEQESAGQFNSLFKAIPEVLKISTTTALEFADGSRSVLYFLDIAGGSREIHLYAEPQKGFKVDWNSLYLCGTTPFKQFVDAPPKEIQDIYCYINVDTYYSNVFPENEYQSLELKDYSGETLLYAYVNRDTYMDDKLANAMLESDLTLHGKNTIRACLTLKYSPQSIRPSAEIIDVIGTDWIAPLMRK